MKVDELQVKLWGLPPGANIVVKVGDRMEEINNVFLDGNDVFLEMLPRGNNP